MLAFARLLRGQAIALLALFVALSGTAYAAHVAAKNSVVSTSIKNGTIATRDVKNGAITAKKVAPGRLAGSQIKDDSLTGADIDEDSLAPVPAAVSAQLGGQAWASPTGSCTPTSTTSFEVCVEKTFTMPAAGQLALVGEAAISHRNDNQYPATAYCQYRVDGVAGGTTPIVKAGGTLASGWAEFAPLLYTADVPAGPVTVGIWCEDNYYSKLSGVRFIAMAASPTS